MYSNQWNGNSSLWKTSQFKGQKKQYSFRTQNLPFCQNEKDRCTDGILVMKMDILAKKLNKKKNQERFIDNSRYTCLKSTKCPDFVRMENHQEFQSSNLRTTKLLEESPITELEKLEEKALFFMDKSKDLGQLYRNHHNDLSMEVQSLMKIVKEIGDRSVVYNPVRKEFRLYSDILQTFHKESESVLIRKPQSRVVTKSSACKDPSLLLSFKKNVDEDDGYVTLKYSEESVNREGNETLIQGWTSFQRDTRQKGRRRNDVKNSLKDFEFVPEPVEDRYFQGIKEQILNHLGSHKKSIANELQQNTQFFNKFEDVLEQIVEKIAYQKVEREDTWREVEDHAQQLVNQISSNLIQLRSDGVQIEENWHQKIKDTRLNCIVKIQAQMTERKQEERLMIKMMMEVVDYMG